MAAVFHLILLMLTYVSAGAAQRLAVLWPSWAAPAGQYEFTRSYSIHAAVWVFLHKLLLSAKLLRLQAVFGCRCFYGELSLQPAFSPV